MCFDMSQTEISREYEGGCNCGQLRYRMKTMPLIVQCCHCTWCQRESGSACVVNAQIETDQLAILRGQAHAQKIPSASSSGQTVYKCSDCAVAIFSQYHEANPHTLHVRASTVDRVLVKGVNGHYNMSETRGLDPSVHIFTATKQNWFIIPPNTPYFTEFYCREQTLSEQSLARYRALKNN
ncbi:hypothetical protein ASPVEDRAFT_238691 [Aspergillus versicolor CBS 583.65]|uniref:CENP-V/GFA domain-containing protein n=1 Tax=Aspergillus versicolor CBS 583.65 TaxID=1036611 RepID=A0A1L9P4Z7_ASPVE|nr:uncharacterized protein ASPVEDRAFT_238691 [Aspergillus versicolor CBS 583.65]OJI96493.1 hypothetical protein ASPVEDRAFT_238691 [Aspergillus versicolor CBS 583.65]